MTTKTQVKHTPGPWRYGISSKNMSQFFIGNNDYTKTIAIVDSFHVEHEANAALIAAAPELLEALKQLKEDFSYLCKAHVEAGTEDTSTWLSYQNAKAAITKAEHR